MALIAIKRDHDGNQEAEKLTQEMEIKSIEVWDKDTFRMLVIRYVYRLGDWDKHTYDTMVTWILEIIGLRIRFIKLPHFSFPGRLIPEMEIKSLQNWDKYIKDTMENIEC